jgi:two-component sensor histidine kinase
MSIVKSTTLSVERRAEFGAIACCIALAIADHYIPREAAVGVLYAPIVVLSLLSKRPRFVLFIAALATTLAWLDYLTSVEPGSPIWAIFDRSVGTLAIWVCAALGLQRLRYQQNLEQALRIESLLRREVDHRVRNHLTLLSAMVNLNLNSVSDLTGRAQLVEALATRLSGMTRVHQTLSAQHGGSVQLADLIRSISPPTPTTSPGSAEPRVRAIGPDVLIPAHQVPALGAVLHELILNSAKHGALAAEGGGLEIQWDITPDPAGGARRLELFWQEFGGPAIHDYPHPGTGTELIVGFVRDVLGGEAELAFPQGGAFHRFTLLLRDQPSAADTRPPDSGHREPGTAWSPILAGAPA